MIVLDVNILLYAYSSDPGAPFRAAAAAHLEAIFSQTEPIGIPVQCIWAFLRLSSQPALARNKVNLRDSFATVEQWLALPHVSILYPGQRHWELVKHIATQAHVTGNLIPDVSIAALALEYGAVVHSNDRDFARFPDVRWHNPLAS